MESLWNGLTRLSKAAIVAGFALLLLAAFIVTGEVLVRKAIPLVLDVYEWAFGKLGGTDARILACQSWWGGGGGPQVPGLRSYVRDCMTFSGSDEISGYLFAVGTSWAMSHVLISRGHVRIDALYGMFSPAVRAWLDLVALLMLAIFVGAVVERAGHVAYTNLIELNRSNTNLRIPLAWAQIPWFFGLLLFMVTTVFAILRVLTLLLKGDYAKVNEIAGASTQDEEIEGELKGLGIEMPHVEKK
jgi:TRAP-type C4-dicarboxylate transport system permease small subunit